MKEKMCSGCKVPQPLENFSKNKNTHDGRTWNCKWCHAQWRKAWYWKNREHYLKQQKERLARKAT